MNDSKTANDLENTYKVNFRLEEVKAELDLQKKEYNALLSSFNTLEQEKASQHSQIESLKLALEYQDSYQINKEADYKARIIELTKSYDQLKTEKNAQNNKFLTQISIKEGYIERAILYLDQYSFISEHPNIKTFNLVLQSCCSLKHSERALAIFENMKNNSKLPKPTIETYEILIFTINETKKTNKVLEIIADIPLAQLANSELLQQISIECFVKQSRYEEAFEVFHKSEYKPSILPKFINSLLKTHYNEKAVELYFSYKNFLNTDEIIDSFYFHLPFLSTESSFLIF